MPRRGNRALQDGIPRWLEQHEQRFNSKYATACDLAKWSLHISNLLYMVTFLPIVPGTCLELRVVTSEVSRNQPSSVTSFTSTLFLTFIPNRGLRPVCLLKYLHPSNNNNNKKKKTRSYIL